MAEQCDKMFNRGRTSLCSRITPYYSCDFVSGGYTHKGQTPETVMKASINVLRRLIISYEAGGQLICHLY